MKTLKSLLAVSLIAAAFGAANVNASSKLVTPHQKDASPTVQTTVSEDGAHALTALGYAAKSKSAGPAAAVVSATPNPNLATCNKVGKAVCPICGTAVPCSTKTIVMACCK